MKSQDNRVNELMYLLRQAKTETAENAYRSVNRNVSEARSELWNVYNNTTMTQEEYRELEQMFYEFTNKLDQAYRKAEPKVQEVK